LLLRRQLPPLLPLLLPLLLLHLLVLQYLLPLPY
jgi:hypothetical protein